MIQPVVAGQFYEGSKESLKKQLEECFESKSGPSSLPEKRKAEKLFGIIAPHAGYFFSGSAAAFAYKALAESRHEKTFIILAPDHNGFCRAITTTRDDFETPLGITRTDRAFVEKLMKKCSMIKEGIMKEHAIEVQLPFIQYLFKDVKIVPLIIPSGESIEALAEAIAEIGNCTIIASSDFTHYGLSYGYLPFKENIRANLEKLDAGAIKFIEKLDAKEFLSYIEKTGATICGCFAIATAIETVKRMGAKKAELLKYYTSGDVVNDYTNSVSYAALGFI